MNDHNQFTHANVGNPSSEFTNLIGKLTNMAKRNHSDGSVYRQIYNKIQNSKTLDEYDSNQVYTLDHNGKTGVDEIDDLVTYRSICRRNMT